MSLIDDHRGRGNADTKGASQALETGSPISCDPVSRLADYIEGVGLKPLGAAREYRYASLPLCVIDAVFSIGVRYTHTQAVVERFCDRTHWPRFAASREGRGAGSQSLSDLLALYSDRNPNAAADELFGNWQRTSTRSGILKSDAVKLFAEVLVQNQIGHFDDITPERLERAEAIILGLPGQGSGIAFDYFRMLAGDDDLIKPDRMIQRFVASALDRGREPEPRQAAVLVRLAARELARRGSRWTPLRLDYAIWRHQSAKQGVS